MQAYEVGARPRLSSNLRRRVRVKLLFARSPVRHRFRSPTPWALWTAGVPRVRSRCARPHPGLYSIRPHSRARPVDADDTPLALAEKSEPEVICVVSFWNDATCPDTGHFNSHSVSRLSYIRAGHKAEPTSVGVEDALMR